MYHKCIPEIVKFEQKLINFENENQKHIEILNRFDENLTQKANKSVIKELEKKFVNMANLDSFKLEIENLIS